MTAPAYYVDRGIAVFKPNVRGSTGLGRTYVTLDDQKKRLDSVRDLIDMVAFLKADGRVDASRAAVIGGSGGGYMVNAVVGAYPDAFDAGVSIFGVGNWVATSKSPRPALGVRQDRIRRYCRSGVEEILHGHFPRQQCRQDQGPGK